MKKLLFAFVLIFLTACQQTSEVTNKATCLQAKQSIENAKYQQDVLDKQLMLMAAVSVDDTKRSEAENQRKKLKAAMLMFERIVEDPELDCSKYLK